MMRAPHLCLPLLLLLQTGCSRADVASHDAAQPSGQALSQKPMESAASASSRATGAPRESTSGLAGRFVGTRKLHGPLPEQSGDSGAIRNAGVEAYFGPEGAKSVLRITEDGSLPYRLKIDVPGNFDADGGWTGMDAGTRIRIGKDGRLSGTGRIDAFNIKFSGRLSRDRFSLQMDLEASGEGALNRSSHLTYDYAMRKEQPKDGVAGEQSTRSTSRDQSAGEGQGKGCTVRWKLKNVTDFNGGMDLIRVPVCE